MLIIFDLDDTLVQTTRTLTPFQLKRAVTAMVEAGLAVEDIDAAITQIQEMDLRQSSAKETLKLFLGERSAHAKFFEIGYREIYEKICFEGSIAPMPRVNEVLNRLGQEHLLAVVTAGDPENQKKKMEKAGIDTRFFSKIIVCDKHEKGFYYQELVSEFDCLPKDVIVCGDRIDRDLKPAKELGMQTVLIRQGRGENESYFDSHVDQSIREIEELIEVIEGVKK